MGLSHSPKIATDGLVFYVDAANNRSYPGTGTAWDDLVGENNGTLTNGPTFSAVNGGGIDFDGTDDYVTIPDHSSLHLATGTVSLWFNADDISSGSDVDKLFTKDGGSPAHSAGDFQLCFYGYKITLSTDNGSGSTVISDTRTVQVGRWYHIVATCDGTNERLYVDGNLSVTGSRGDPLFGTHTEPAEIGNRSRSGASHAFNGRITAVSVYNRALTAAEIRTMFDIQRGRFGV